MKKIGIFIVLLLFITCKKRSPNLVFLSEYVFKDSVLINNTIIGGISGIDFFEDNYYMVVDDAKSPRVLVGDILIKEDSINKVIFKKVIKLDSTHQIYKNNALDLEGVFATQNQLHLVSEGSIKKKKDPGFFTVDFEGKFQEQLQIPEYFKATSKAKPKHNATFESSSKSFDGKGFWVGMEGVLEADGEEPTMHKTQSPVRITYFDNQTKKATKQFAYQLEKIDNPAKGNINLNGVTAILEYTKNNFFVVERIYQNGYGSHGNTIRIFKATIDNSSTNTLKLQSLKKEKYIPLKKELLLDLKEVENKLTDTIIDNIEGITFGSKLSNGNQSLVLVSDDNFQIYGKQLNQFLLLEIEYK